MDPESEIMSQVPESTVYFNSLVADCGEPGPYSRSQIAP